MPYAIELFFDPAADQAVRQAWTVVGPAVGLPNRLLEISGRPHVSLAVLDGCGEAALVSMLADLASRHAPFPLSLDSVGMFASPEGVVFLGPAPSQALSAIHHDCLGQLDFLNAQVSEHYLVDRLVFHCTLNHRLGRDEQLKAAAAALNLKLPVLADIVELGLVRLPEVELVKVFRLAVA